MPKTISGGGEAPTGVCSELTLDNGGGLADPTVVCPGNMAPPESINGGLAAPTGVDPDYKFGAESKNDSLLYING